MVELGWLGWQLFVIQVQYFMQRISSLHYNYLVIDYQFFLKIEAVIDDSLQFTDVSVGCETQVHTGNIL